MSWIDQLLKRLFDRESASSGALSRQPVWHGVLERQATDRRGYQQWLESYRMAEMLTFLQEEYHRLKESDNYVGAVFYHLNQPSAQGFRLNFREELFEQQEFRYYFDYLRDRTLLLDYKLYTSDVRQYDRGSHVETIERHYLKPSWRLAEDGQRMVQQFGNITITHQLHDDRSIHLTFLVQRYADRQYTVAEDYERLIEHMIQ